VVSQTIRVILDGADVEGATFPSRASFSSTPRASLHAFSHASSHASFRTPLRVLAPAPFAHVSLL
jgi:hypothetical protein